MAPCLWSHQRGCIRSLQLHNKHMIWKQRAKLSTLGRYTDFRFLTLEITRVNISELAYVWSNYHFWKQVHSGRASSPASVSNSSYPDHAGYKAKNHITKATVRFIAQDIRLVFFFLWLVLVLGLWIYMVLFQYIRCRPVWEYATDHLDPTWQRWCHQRVNVERSVQAHARPPICCDLANKVPTHAKLQGRHYAQLNYWRRGNYCGIGIYFTRKSCHSLTKLTPYLQSAIVCGCLLTHVTQLW